MKRHTVSECVEDSLASADRSSPRGCVECTSHLDENGYCRRSVRGEMKYVHRLMWEEVNGRIPSGIDILHECDNPRCINIAHLRPGTHADNMEDMTVKLRCAHRKLSPEIVVEIKAIHETGFAGYSTIADAYQINKHHVRDIVKGRAWKHLDKQILAKR